MKLIKLLEEYQSEFDYDVSEFIELISSNGFSRENLDRHFTASAWVYAPKLDSVVMMHHKKLNKWMQPGGHADGDSDLENVARKEVFEEVGLDNLILVKSIFDLDVHIIPEYKLIPQHLHFDVRFLYFVENDKLVPNHESNEVNWIKIDQVNNYSSDESILRLANKTKDWI